MRTDANPLNQKTTNSYYADGFRESESNPNGHSTTFVYDTCCGRLIEVIDADQNSIKYENDSNGNRTKVTDQSGRVTAFVYDGLNRQIKMIVDPVELNLQTTTEYDPTPGVVGRAETTTSPAWQVVTINYDGLARVARMSGETPQIIYTYDLIEDGFLKHTTTDANGNNRSSLADGAGRKVKTIDGLGQATVLTYDNNNNLLTLLDRDGRKNRYVYDERNRRIGVIEDDGGIGATTQFQYDAVDNLLQITDATGKVTGYAYDNANRRLVASYAVGTNEARSWNYQYFPLGQLKQLTKPNQVIINYAYDNLERLSSRKYLAGRTKLGADTFDYHANGLLKKAVGGLYNTTVDRSKLAPDYDGANRLVQEQQKIGGGPKTVTYTYDPDNLIKQITYPSGNRMQQTYTDRRELFEVKLDDQVQASHAYDAAGRRTSRTYANSRITQWNYDAEDRNTRLDHVNVQAWDYRYTNEGDALVQDDLTTPARGEAYAYDGMHRLIDNKRGQVTGNTVPTPTFFQSWALDKVGNWTTWKDNGINETRTHNNHHGLTSRSTVPFPQAYDANFNQTDDGSAFTFVYDANDQLEQVKNRLTGAVLVRYSYDAFGRRVEKSIPKAPPDARVTRYYYCEQRIIEERNGRDAVQAIYTYGTYIDEPLTMDRGGERFYYHSNKQFSTYTLTNSAGQIVERYSYTPYGQATTFDAAYQNPGFTSHVGNPFTFTGRELDAETGLMHFRARYYDPLKGRFLQRDPLGYVDGMNLSEYVRSNPVNRRDPFGGDDGIIESFIEDSVQGLLDKINWRAIVKAAADSMLDKVYAKTKAEAQRQSGLDLSPLDPLHSQYKEQLKGRLDSLFDKYGNNLDVINEEIKVAAEDAALYALTNPGKTGAAVVMATAAAVLVEEKTGVAIIPKSYGQRVGFNAFGLGEFSMNAKAYRESFRNVGVSATEFRFESRKFYLGSSVYISGFAECPATSVAVSLKEGFRATYGGEVGAGLNVTILPNW